MDITSHNVIQREKHDSQICKDLAFKKQYSQDNRAFRGYSGESQSFPYIFCLWFWRLLQFPQLTTALSCGTSHRDRLHNGKLKLVFICVLLSVYKKGKFKTSTTKSEILRTTLFPLNIVRDTSISRPVETSKPKPLKSSSAA